MSQTSPYAPAFLPLFQSYQEEYLQRLETLVNIDSGTGQNAGVDLIMTHLQQWVGELGCAVMLRNSDGFGTNLIARRSGNGNARILLVGHVDTVYPAGAVQKQPYELRDGKIYGPGVLDMKSGVLLGIYALRALLESDFNAYKEIIFLFNNDEEVGSPASRELIQELAPQVDYALVLEPAGSSSSVTHSRKGTEKYMLEVTGKAAHSGVEPFKGRSAVVELAHKILAIQNLHASFPGVTFNVTRLSSTEPLNVVPDMARCYISMRGFNAHSMNAAAAALEHIVSQSSVPGTQAKLVREGGGRPPYEPNTGILQLLAMAEEEADALGVRLKAETKGGVSDANMLVNAGIPTLDTLGPIGGGMHNLELEHLQVSSIPVRGALLVGLLHRICLA
ncbi:MAG TPA: M20 family metallopeptidase [Dictyobacter sp.]|jgi:glutamate carboxypeptidase|nr:M20 family metallopeptidase [Dictyobacter sp.]